VLEDEDELSRIVEGREIIDLISSTRRN